MIAALTLWNSAFAQVSQTVPICLEFQTDWDDEGYGDFWNTNDNRPARYLLIEVTDDFSTKTATLDANGCKNMNLQFNSGKQQKTIDVVARARAFPRGIRVELRHHAVAAENARWTSATEQFRGWVDVVVPTQLPPGNTIVLTTVANEGWEVLAIATWMLHRNDLHLHVPNSRNCCLENDAEFDGSCKPTGTMTYDRSVDPYLTSAPMVPILTHNGPGCCSSHLAWADGDDRSGFSAVQTSGLSGSRFSLAHELGHVMVGIRMGGKEWSQYPDGVFEDGCHPEWRRCTSLEQSNNWCSSDGWIPMSFNQRGVLTKEWGAKAAREGWADFLAMWTWNNRTQPNCDTTSPSLRYDFDLDGDIDSAPGQPVPADPTPLDCHGLIQWAPMPGNPLASWVSDRNWLGDAVANAPACGSVSTCSSPSGNQNMESMNRSTVYDWSKMFWYMTQEEGLLPDQLSDLYVDMCPRKWRPTDGDCTAEYDLPLYRFLLSSDHHGWGWEGLRQVDHVLH